MAITRISFKNVKKITARGLNAMLRPLWDIISNVYCITLVQTVTLT